MSTHDHGSLYRDWQRTEIRITALERELEAEQVVHVDLSEYQIGSERYERLYGAMEQAQRFQWPSDGYAVNV